MQIAIQKALASAFTKHVPVFSSLQYQYLCEEEPEHPTSAPFPFDVKFLSHDTLNNFITYSADFETEFWPNERIQAYMGKDLCAKRAAVTPFLWARYSEYPDMTLKLLEKWHHVEILEQLLTIPLWFRNQHVHEKNIAELWKEKLGSKKQEYEQQHMALLQEIQDDMNAT